MATVWLYRRQFAIRSPQLVGGAVLAVVAAVLLVIAGRLYGDARRYAREAVEVEVLSSRVVPAEGQRSTAYELTYRLTSASGLVHARSESVPVTLWEAAVASGRVRVRRHAEGVADRIWQPSATSTIAIVTSVGIVLACAGVALGAAGVRTWRRARAGVTAPPSWADRQLANVSFWTLFGSIWLIVGVPFVLLTAFFVWEDWRLSTTGRTVNGMVLVKNIAHSGSGPGGDTFRHSVRYRFEVDGRAREGTAEVAEPAWALLVERDPVSIQYLSGWPTLHRMAGTNQRGELVIFGGVGLLIGGAGTLIVGADLRRKRRVRRLQASGVRARATVVSVEAMNVRVNRERLWRIRYEYRDSKQGARRGAAYVSEEEAARWSLGDQAAILMDPAQPQSTVWIGEATESPA